MAEAESEPIQKRSREEEGNAKNGDEGKLEEGKKKKIEEEEKEEGVEEEEATKKHKKGPALEEAEAIPLTTGTAAAGPPLGKPHFPTTKTLANYEDLSSDSDGDALSLDSGLGED